MRKLQQIVRAGDRVRVRQQRWRIVAVRAYEACQLFTLAGLGPFNAGLHSSVLAPFDRIEPLERVSRVRIVQPRLWRRRCRALVAADCAAGSLRAAPNARIDLLPHQLEPALGVVRGLGSRVLLADEVGLGKTIQAGLIVAELRARGAGDRVLVLTPAGLRDQWHAELTGRFALDCRIVDMRAVRHCAALLPAGLNPWSTLPAVIASIDFIKRPEVLPAVLSCRWDVIVVDEAHGVTAGSDRHVAVSSLCRRAPHIVLLTATPHNGDRAAFYSLCGIGSLDDEPLLVFRRDRREVALGAGRRVHRVRIASSAAERRMHELLARFTQAVRLERGDGDPRVWLALTTLHKRALSSARSLHESIGRRLEGLSTDAGDRGAQLALPIDDACGELDGSDQPPIWTTPALDDDGRERRMLTRLSEAARAAAPDESKLRRLATLLARLRRRREPAVIFTEYRDTLLHVHRTLGLPCALLHGGLSRDERRNAVEDFQSGRRSILLSTDAGGEGLNLHHTCRVVINLELPWNPMRLEQRIGRVDRIGQQRRVHAFNLIACDTGEMRVYDRLKARIARAQQDIGVADPLDSSSADSEEVVARLVIEGDEADTGPETGTTITDGGLADAPKLTFVRLRDAAASERVRLLHARAMTTGNDRTPAPESSSDSWLAFARRPLTRARLAGRVLVILQSVLEDCGAHGVALHLAPLVLQMTSRLRSLSSSELRAFFRRLIHEPSLMEFAGSNWREESVRVHADFWRTRLNRERAIAAHLTDTGGASLFQPGLFDLRAVRMRRLEAQELDTARREAARHAAAAEEASRIDREATHVALVLLP